MIAVVVVDETRSVIVVVAKSVSVVDVSIVTVPVVVAKSVSVVKMVFTYV